MDFRRFGYALEAACEVHEAQLDLSGEPYIFHVMRVAMAMETDEERVVALLHDVLEDCPPGDKGSRIVNIIDNCGTAIIDAVEALTRNEGEEYMEYIRRLSTNPLAVKVKLADLADNRRRDRLSKLLPSEANRLFDRYEKAYCLLIGKQWEHEDQARVGYTVHQSIELVIDPTASTIGDSIQNIVIEEEMDIEEAKERFNL